VIVCHCRVVTDQQVKRAVANGAHSVAQVCGATGAGRDCGSCVFSVKRLLCKHEASEQVSLLEVDGAAS